MSHWFDKAVEELETDLENGLMTQEEFRTAMRDLNAELRDARAEAAHDAYNDYY